MKRLLGLEVALLLVAGLLAPAAAASESTGRYIVVLNDSVSSATRVAQEHSRSHGARVSRVYEAALKGYAAEIPEGAVAGIARDRRVAFVEEDQTVHALAQDIPTGIKRTFAVTNPNIDVDGSDDVRVDVDVAVIDTGIDFDHPDLNVVARTNCAKGGPFNQSCADNDGDDGNGHGTHVAGTIGAIDNGLGVVGMAPGARLWAVKVLGNDGSGWMSWIVAGIDWVTSHSADIEVANMSLGCACDSDSLDAAIASSVDAGVVYAVAAGNSDANAATHSPANHPDVITVSALADFNGLPGGGAAPTCRNDEDDTFANFSNWGSTIEVAAPGVCILSTWNGGGYNTISGTSMASPHVAGAAALLASKNNPDSDTDVFRIRSTLVAEGNFDWDNADDGDATKEPLLDVGDTTVFAPVLVAGTGSGGGGGGGSDTTAPTDVVVTAPSAGSTLSGTAAVSATASDDVGVAKVEFFANGTKIGEDTDGSNGWSISWNTTTVTDGAYTLTAKASDAAGNSTTSAGVGVTVDNPDTWSLTATGYKVKGSQMVDLSWSNAPASGAVDIWRKNGTGDFTDVGDATTGATGTGAFTDSINKKGKGTYTYKICEATNPNSCSNEVTVSFG
jgi:subtilisin